MNLTEAIAEIQQPRSRFQLEAFVLGQHDTPEMQFYQLCIEAQDLSYKIRLAEIGVRRAQAKIADTAVDPFDREEAALGLEQTMLALTGARRELAVLQEIFDDLPQHFTRAEIEAAQPEYWRQRLTRQASLEQMGTGIVGWAQLDTMRQAGLLEQFILEHGRNENEPPALAAVPS